MSLPTKKARGNAVHFKNSHCLLQQSSNSGAPCTLLDPDSVPEGYAVIQHDFGCRLLKNLPVENPTCCLKYYVSVQQRTPPLPNEAAQFLTILFVVVSKWRWSQVHWPSSSLHHVHGIVCGSAWLCTTTTRVCSTGGGSTKPDRSGAVFVRPGRAPESTSENTKLTEAGRAYCTVSHPAQSVGEFVSRKKNWITNLFGTLSG